jgi:hypothetical protein
LSVKFFSFLLFFLFSSLHLVFLLLLFLVLPSYFFPSFNFYTVTRPYEGFRHPDWMAPESTVRGRENDSLVRPGYLHPLLTSFSGGSGIFRRFSL